MTLDDCLLSAIKEGATHYKYGKYGDRLFVYFRWPARRQHYVNHGKDDWRFYTLTYPKWIPKDAMPITEAQRMINRGDAL